MPELPQIIRLLQRVPLFRGVEPGRLTKVARAASYVEVNQEGFFFRQAEPAVALYVLHAGRIKLAQSSPEGHEVVLRLVAPGDTFGAAAVLENHRYTASAQAVRWSQALAWNGRTMALLMEDCPRIALNTLNHLADTVEELGDRYCELATEPVEQRLARTLIRLAGQTGWNTEGGLLIDTPLSRQDLAEMTGATLYTVSRILSGWQRSGFIDAGRQRVSILHMPQLQAIADHVPAAGNGCARRFDGKRRIKLQGVDSDTPSATSTARPTARPTTGALRRAGRAAASSGKHDTHSH